MSPTSKTVYLVSGANRGIGLGLVTALAARPDTVVYAGARDLTKVPALDELAKKYPGVVHAVKLTSTDETDNKAAVKEIEAQQGRLDVVIANAGISKYYNTVLATPVQEFRDHWEVNTLGVVVLWQAAGPLLLKSPTKAPKFFAISTGGASIGQHFNIQAGAYASSKTAMNFIVKQISAEHEAENLTASVISPGWVQTEMGNAGATANGMKEAPVTIDGSVNGILGIIDGSSRSKNGGSFLDFEKGDVIPW
ncbi:NAD(P)-binding protein [Mycena vitilis]|nr:NAD(P)-binding protein [Mycena vitilis]